MHALTHIRTLVAITTVSPFDHLQASLLSKGKALSHEELTNLVTKMFLEIDVNKDGKLSFEEFKQAVETQQLLISCFVHYPEAAVAPARAPAPAPAPAIVRQ